MKSLNVLQDLTTVILHILVSVELILHIVVTPTCSGSQVQYKIALAYLRSAWDNFVSTKLRFIFQF